jgi:acetyl esterase/lipase
MTLASRILTLLNPKIMILKTLIFLTIATIARAEWVDLWPTPAPGAPRPPAHTEQSGEGGRLSQIEVPQYWVYLPEKEKSTGAAAVILPGGGYGILASNHEGHDYAKWLTSRGIAGILVKYRVGQKLGYEYPVPFLDARRAIRTVRANAEKWSIDPKRIGIMGSSAGGHLASLCATRFHDRFAEEARDAVDQQSCRPDFAVLIYPVISMSTEIAHQGSRTNLLGQNPDPALTNKLSTATAVTKETPPVFLLTTSDDNVDCRNSLEFAIACKAQGVPVTLHLFEKGGHGYGLKGKDELSAWPALLETWMKKWE